MHAAPRKSTFHRNGRASTHGHGAPNDHCKDGHANKTIQSLTHKVEALQKQVRELRTTHMQEVTHLKMELVKLQRDSNYEPDVSVTFTPNKAPCEDTKTEEALSNLRTRHVVGRMKYAVEVTSVTKKLEATKEELETMIKGMNVTLGVYKMLAVALTILFDTSVKALLAAAKRMGYENISQFIQRVREGQGEKELAVLDWMVSSRLVKRNTMHVATDDSSAEDSTPPPDVHGVNLDAAMQALKKGSVLTSLDVWRWPEDFFEQLEGGDSAAALLAAARNAELLRKRSTLKEVPQAATLESEIGSARLSSAGEVDACNVPTLEDRATSPVERPVMDRATSPIEDLEDPVIEELNEHAGFLEHDSASQGGEAPTEPEPLSLSQSSLGMETPRWPKASPRSVALLPGLRIDKTKPCINIMAGLEESDAWAAGNCLAVPSPGFLPCARKKTTKTVVVKSV